MYCVKKEKEAHLTAVIFPQSSVNSKCFILFKKSISIHSKFTNLQEMKMGIKDLKPLP